MKNLSLKLNDCSPETLKCEASTELALQLSGQLFKQVRVTGQGTWERAPEGPWQLRKLKIESFAPLDIAKASTVLAKMQALGGLKWAEMDDPHGLISDMRG